MVVAHKGTLVQCDESIMAIIEKIDKDRGHTYITERLDTETCLIAPEKIAELERLVKDHIQKHMPDVEGSDME